MEKLLHSIDLSLMSDINQLLHHNLIDIFTEFFKKLFKDQVHKLLMYHFKVLCPS